MVSKRYKSLLKSDNETSSKSIEDLLSIIKKNATAKFDESIDLSFQINNKQKR